MYAVLMTGGKQYRVEAGSTLVVEKVSGEPGSSINFDRILLVGDGEDVTVGSPRSLAHRVQAPRFWVRHSDPRSSSSSSSRRSNTGVAPVIAST